MFTQLNQSQRLFVYKFCPNISLRSLTWLLTALLLAGCNLSYQTKHSLPLQIEHTFIAKDTPLDPRIQQLSFTAFDMRQMVMFSQQKQDLLLRIQVSDTTVDASEYTLSLYPKYLQQVSYFNIKPPAVVSPVVTQFRNRTDDNRYYSSQKFAFNLDRAELPNSHYLLVRSEHNRYVHVALTDANSYIKADAQFSHFTTLVYSVILAMILFNAVFYLYTRGWSYLLYTIYMLTALYSLLWQEGKINDLPAIAWYVLGSYSGLVYLAIADLAANLFFFRFLRLRIGQDWLVKLVLACVAVRIGIILTALFQYHVAEQTHYAVLSQWFNISMVVSSLLAWVIILRKTLQHFPQAQYLLMAWSILIAAVLLRIYFSLNPSPHNLWMAHSYEVAIMLEGLLLAFAMAGRTMEFRKQRDQAVNKYTVAERSIYKHQMITQFQHEMQELVRDPTLSQEQVDEKTNIKFHLLLHRAMPIKNSLIHVNNHLHGICTTGLQPLDIELLEYKLNQIFTTNSKNQIGQHEIITANKQLINMLYLPLTQQDEDIRFVLGLKNNQTIKPQLAHEFQTYCEAAYDALQQARELYQVALAANSDSMTECHNRHSIEQVITESLKTAKRTTLAYIDLDNLKDINDSHGHAIGDQCIIEFTQLLKKSLNQHAKLGRIGGDEFLAVFADVEFERCEELLELFMELLANNTISEAALTITSSVGLAESRLHETTQSLIKKADQALYHSKHKGRNQITVYSNDMTSKQ